MHPSTLASSAGRLTPNGTATPNGGSYVLSGSVIQNIGIARNSADNVIFFNVVCS